MRILFTLLLTIAMSLSVKAANLSCGLTIITHGYQRDQIGGSYLPPWTRMMAEAITNRIGVSLPVYRLRYDKQSGSTTGDDLIQLDDGASSIDITQYGGAILLLDWAAASNETIEYPAQKVANKFFEYIFGQTHNGRDLAEIPIHLIGHSRGCSVNAQLALNLAGKGVLVDQVTTLDPHPVQSGGNDLIPVTYINVLFADNYYQDEAFPEGREVAGAFNQPLGSVFDSKVPLKKHEQVHTYYHGTVNLSRPLTIDEEDVDANWYLGTASPDSTGYNFSRFINPLLERPASGVNQFMSGAGGTGSRVAVDSQQQLWSNAGFNQRSAIPSVVKVGQTVDIPYFFSDRSSAQTITFYTDADTNPYNGFRSQIGSAIQNSRPAGSIGTATFQWTPTASDVGAHYIRIKGANASSARFDYYLKPISVQPAATPTLTISGVTPRTFTGPTKLVTVTGSGFTANSRLNFMRGATPFLDRVPIFISENELRYDISVGTDAASWTVTVANGQLQTLPYEFYVVKGGTELTGLSISGPSAVTENSGGAFTAKAYFTDGTSPTVNAAWSVTGGPVSINASSGQLTAGNVNGNSAVKVTASYTSGGITKSTSTDVMIVNSGGGGGFQTQQLIVDGSFDSGGSGWALTGAFQADSRFETCRSCPGYAYLSTATGAPGNNLSGTMSQTFTIPVNATDVALDYWHRTTTAELGGSSDRIGVQLRLSNGTLVGLDGISNADANTAYSRRTVDLSGYKGQTVTLEFLGATSPGAPTTFRLDDVSVIATIPIPKTPVLLGLGGPSSVQEGMTGQYEAVIVYSDGTVESVSPTWRENSNATTISSLGLLTAGSVNSDTAVTISATFPLGGVPATVNKDITVVNVASEFSYLAINGPSTINENSSGQYTATAIFSNGSSETVSPSWSVTIGPGSMSNSGTFTVGEVSDNATVTVSASYTIDGVTRNTSQQVAVNNVPTPVALVSLAISGPSSVSENGIAQYTASASFSDGSSQGVTAQWNEDSPFISISSFGFLSTVNVSTETRVTITASYTFGAVTRTAGKEVTILDGSITPTFESLIISGPASINENTTAQYTATASFSDGSTQVVIPTWAKSSAAVGISNTGVLNAGEVLIDTPVTISASYTIGNVTRTASRDVTISNVTDPNIFALTIVARNGTVSKNPNLASYTSGSTVVLTALAAADYQFASWSGSANGRANPLTVTMDGNKEITANFTPVQIESNSIVTWGQNSEGQNMVPFGLSGSVAISAGGYHSLALTSDNTIGAWGRDIDGESTIPLGLGKVIKVVAGGYHSLALKTDGSVTAWGRNEEGQATVPLDLSGVTAIAAGYHHTLALKSNGSVVAWGRNADGEATVPAGLNSVVAIAGGGDHSLALRNDGTVVAWGLNSHGQGVVPADLNGVTAIAAGADHNVALKSDGTVVAWGRNNQGQSTVPADLTGVIAITAGGDHSVALRSNGTVVAWGLNDSGQTTVPAGLSGVTAIAAGFFHTVAFKSDGSVVFWGQGTEGQTTPPLGTSGVVAIAAGGYHSLALTSDNTIMAWGRDIDRESTVPIGLGKVIKVVAGGYHSVALKSDGAVAAWGRNEEGQATVPLDLSAVTAIAAGYHHTLALKSNGSVVAWGRNADGEATVPAGLNSVVAIAGGGDHSLALRNDGTVVAWGLNSHGQGVVPADLNGATAIAAGADHNVALKSDGTVVAWGRNNQGQTTVPADLTGVIAIAAGGDHSVALRSNGTVVAWGLNDSGQSTVPSGLSGVTAIAAGFFHTMALVATIENTPVLEITQKSNGVVLSWPLWSTGFVLEVNNTLSMGESWTRVANGISTSGDRFTFSDTANPQIAFYRLRRL